MYSLMRKEEYLKEGLRELINDIETPVNLIIEIGCYVGESTVIFAEAFP